MKIVKKIVFITVVIIILILLYFNIIMPISVECNKVECINWDATYESIVAFEKNYNEGDYDRNTVLIHSFDGKLPSHNKKDYMTVYINFNVKNRGIIDNFLIDAVVENIENNENMALWSNTAANVEMNTAWRREQAEGTIVMDIYIKDYSNEDIKEFIKGLNIKVVCKGKILGKREFYLKLSDVEKISIER